ncbi:MAG: hypothetical protein KGL48_13120 [Sphingomonadales bacterium]|nr:hypothetical protein [Sphingomonadales bacterium]
MNHNSLISLNSFPLGLLRISCFIKLALLSTFEKSGIGLGSCASGTASVVESIFRPAGSFACFGPFLVEKAGLNLADGKV